MMKTVRLDMQGRDSTGVESTVHVGEVRWVHLENSLQMERPRDRFW